MVEIGDVVTEAQPGFACGAQDPDGIFQFRMHNVSKSCQLELDKRRRVPPTAHKDIAKFRVNPGDVLFNATNSPDNVGKSVLVSELDEPAVFSNHFLRLRTDTHRLDPSYLWRWLQLHFDRGTFTAMCHQWVNQASLSREKLLNLPISLPPLDEQHRIAAILERADELRTKRRKVLAEFDNFADAAFQSTFGDALNHASASLGELTQITSGITKGRKVSAPTKPVPYLAVANVQAGHLQLDHVKSIDATDVEIERYALAKGDLVLTEGGDPDKLGRGTVWRNELPLCLHQNHIFRVRITNNSIVPDYLAAYLSSQPAKSYFLRAAKQTTGIASINMTQLRATPVHVPTASAQAAYLSRIRSAETLRRQVEVDAIRLDELFASLQSRAFSGDL